MTNGLDPALAWTLRLALAILFAAAARHKLMDPAAFRRTVAAYQVLPVRVVSAVSIGVIAVEATLTAAFLTPGGAGVAATGALTLLALYTGAIGWNLARGRRDIDCGCFGPGRRQPLTSWLVGRNLVVAIGSALLLSETTSRPWLWIDAITLVGGVATISFLWMAANQLAAPAANRTGRIV